MDYALNGLWQADIGDGTAYPMELPGTLDENGIGFPDSAAGPVHPDDELGNKEGGFGQNGPIATRFTRKYTFEGKARFTRRIAFTPPEKKRVFLEAERARCLELFIDGRPVPHFTEGTLSTPHIFEVTGMLDGDNEIVLLSDNHYPGLPHDAIVYSSAATDETQTNWNGVLGYLRLRVEEPVFLSAVRVYPRRGTLTVRLEISAAVPFEGVVQVESAALADPASVKISVPAGVSETVLERLPLAAGVCRWDEYEGNLYELTAALAGGEEKRVSFGVRDFGDDGKGRLAVNGRVIFLRSEANCAEFPETGHPPMTVEEWDGILKRFKEYGVNCMRFHSHCPPEAAFTAADRLGMLMQPELSHWDPQTAFETKESFRYYRTELKQVILTLANHPSFVMLTFGNELAAHEEGHARMDELLDIAHRLDGTRLFANGSNVHYGAVGCDEKSDFYASQKFYEEPLRGTFAGAGGEEGPGIKGYINNEYPNAMTDYDKTMERIRSVYAKPVFSFEVGQFEVLPDFDELEDFHGISDPANLRMIREKAERLGLGNVWKEYVEATGELSRIGYREEIEAALRTEQLSGISLLGLQDFPGQGTALVGMLNSHLNPKPFPFARPEAFRAFFREQLPLVLLPKYTYEAGETLQAEVKMANYGKKDITGCPRYELKGKAVIASGRLPEAVCPAGALSRVGKLNISLEGIERAVRLELTVSIGDVSNTYPVWVYPQTTPVCPETVYETAHLDERARETLEKGGMVYLTPPSSAEALPFSIQAQFTTDFWSVGTFGGQEGGMGQLIDASHPVFEDFPTDRHTDWQWWPMASQRAVILPQPNGRNEPAVKAIVTEMDSYAYMRPMAQLLECRCGNGRLLFSSMGLQDLQQYPEARALLSSIYRYMASGRFTPKQRMEIDTVAALVS